jgi:hypothetical protein
MDQLKIRYILGALLGLVILMGIGAGLRAHFSSIYRFIVPYSFRLAPSPPVSLSPPQQLQLNTSTSDTNAVSQSNTLELPPGSQANVLELPRASLDFVGVWGAYTDIAVQSVVPGALVAKGADRISVTFGREGDTVFIASELYAGPGQHIVGRPRARMPSPTEALITYDGRDHDLDYVYLHQFRLLRSGKIAYSQKVDIYERRTHSLVGRATQHAMLQQLTTIEERRKFSRPCLQRCKSDPPRR